MYLHGVKRIISFLLLISFFDTTTEAHELFKIHHLLRHYYEHKTEHPSISFTQYINEHYTNEQSAHKNNHHDQDRFPFQGKHCCNVQTVQLLAQEIIDFGLLPPSIDTSTKSSFIEFAPSEFLVSIWQPPKI